MKIIFLDRDGTINKDYEDEEWKKVDAPEILDGAIEGLKGFTLLGYKFIIVTNQHIINDNIISINDYEIFDSHLRQLLKDHDVAILDTFFCPHTADENCKCRKPRDGMVKKALERYPDIELSSAIMIGDSKCDEDLANVIGIKFYGINGQYFYNQYKSLLEIYESVKRNHK